MEQQNDKYNIRSLIKAFNILEILVKNEKLSISELNSMTGYGKSTVHRIVGTFKSINYVDQDIMDGKYFATTKLFELGNIVASRIPIKKIARPYLEELYEECKETVNLGILENGEVLYLDKMITKEPLRIDLEIGRKVPAYCSGLGKAIMAYNGRFDLEKIKFEKFTEKTIGSVKELKAILKKARENGYALDDEEFVDGLVCIGVPVFGYDENVIAAVSVAIPKTRLSEEKKEECIRLLKETSENIRKKAGYDIG